MRSRDHRANGPQKLIAEIGLGNAGLVISRDAFRLSRKYDAVEPENRLVARSLERVWERSYAPPRHRTGLRTMAVRRAPGLERAVARRAAKAGRRSARHLALAFDNGGRAQERKGILRLSSVRSSSTRSASTARPG